MASIEKLGPNKYKIVVSNGYRIDGSKIREKKIITLFKLNTFKNGLFRKIAQIIYA